MCFGVQSETVFSLLSLDISFVNWKMLNPYNLSSMTILFETKQYLDIFDKGVHHSFTLKCLDTVLEHLILEFYLDIVLVILGRSINFDSDSLWRTEIEFYLYFWERIIFRILIIS